jgi:hydrogenase/urease accessory protein HupE
MTVAAAGFVLLCHGTASAHLVTTGLGPVYDGVSHLFLSIDDLLPVVAMALFAGLNGSTAGRRALFVLPVAWLAAGVIGYFGPHALLPAGATAISLLVLGILTATDLKLGPALVTAIAIALGTVHGWLNGMGVAVAGREAAGLIGIVTAIFVLVALLSAWVVSLERPWTRIVVRVAGSWIAAIGLLLLGWTLSGRG